MPNKHNDDRRHHIPKMRFTVTNWAAYEAGLRRRGSLTLWVSDEAIAAWRAPPRTTPGGQARYSETAIETAVMVRLVFHQPLRQTEGLLSPLLDLMGVDLPVPDHTTISRRAARRTPAVSTALSAGPITLVIDSTGLKVFGVSALQLSRDLDVQHKTAYVLAHKLREAMAAEMRGVVLGGDGADVEVDGCYVGGHIRPENRKEDRKDRRLAENQTGKRQVVVVARERDGRTLTQVFGSEDEIVAFIKARVDRATTVHADEAAGWNSLHARFNMKRINHQEAYSLDGACTNQAESFFARLRRAEAGQHHRIGGKYLSRYAAEMAWREDRRRTSNGEQFRAVGFRAAALPPSVDWSGYWQRGKRLAA